MSTSVTINEDPEEGLSASEMAAIRSGAERLEKLFELQARKTPDATAILFKKEETSFRALDDRANRIANHLILIGVRPGSRVGICFDRNPELVAILLGVLKAGGTYVPLDSTYPADRLYFILQDSGVSVLVARSDFMADAPLHIVRCDIDHREAVIANSSSLPPSPNVSADDLAYIIYTSGSTGEPKGVMLAHTAVGLVKWAESCFPNGETSRMAATTSICFDPSIIELFVPLCTGGCIVLKQDALDPFTPDERPTMIAAPPSVLGQLARMNALPESLRVINVGGEALSLGLTRDLYKRKNIEKVFNHYGPTEATTCTAVALVERAAETDPPIGQPICDARIYILDEDFNPVGMGERGEIFIAGRTLARGYVNDPVRTAARFLDDPFVPGDRMYRTGDLGFCNDRGDFEFIGRRDDQVKLRGFRIELGEIEAAMMRLSYVRQAAALIKADGAGRDRLVAYIATDQKLSIKDLRRDLSRSLPSHMLPGSLVILDELPLSPTMKIDRKALPDLAHAPVQQGRGWLPPRQLVIAGVFKQCLGVGDVGPDDNFFDLGGDSLSALEASVEIESLLGQTVAPAMLAHNSTPRSLEAALESHPVDWAGHITTLQPNGVGRPLFCLPDIYGRPLSYLSLARCLAPDFPVYGLSVGPLVGVMANEPSMVQLIDAFVAAVKDVQPCGPYLISGYSFGGTFAQSLAVALGADGERVTLVLIDAPLSTKRPPVSYIAGWAVRELRQTISDIGLNNTARAIYRSRPIWRRWPRMSADVTLNDVPLFVPIGDRRLARGLIQSSVGHVPKPFTGSTIFVKADPPQPTASFLNSDGLYGWRDLLLGSVDVHLVKASHYAMMQEPCVLDIAGCIREAAKVASD